MYDVHTRHCQYSGCKYDDPNCTVYLGFEEPEYPDEDDVVKPTETEFNRRRELALEELENEDSFDELEN